MNDLIFKYHKDLTNHFKDQKKTWDWFSSSKVQQSQREEYKKLLLKNTYRLSRDSEKEIYELVDKANSVLNISKEITLYQELDTMQTNARVSYTDTEIHIVLSGSLIKQLNQEELLAVLAHELSHVLFYETENGDFETTDRIISSIANDPRSSSTEIETARLYRLYIELYCDRGAYQVLKNLEVVIQALVKVSTGLEHVSAINYLKQAHEIFKTDNHGSVGQTHPETFIRAIALEYWTQAKPEIDITKLIDNQWGINRMDIFKKKKINEDTRSYLQVITKPKWIRTELVHSLCRQFFPDFNYSDTIVIDNDLKLIISTSDDTINEYFAYILMDFCYADSSLETAPLGHCFQIAEEMSFQKNFKQILKKETKTTTKELDKLIKQGVEEVSRLSESNQESVYADE